jgi:uncharacterized protein YjeT (DUF2065 family)
MLDLKFIYMFIGFLILISAFSSVLCPVRLKKIFKQIFKDSNHIRSIAIWYLSAGPLIMYSSWVSPGYYASYIMFVIGLGFVVQGILLFFFTRWYQRSVLKPVLKFSKLSFRLVGSISFVLGLVFTYYGLFFL